MTTTPGDEIAYRTTPGGELWHPTGTPQDEATAVAADSIHRQLGASVDDLTARVAAAEAGTSDLLARAITELKRLTTTHIALDPATGRTYYSPGSTDVLLVTDSTGRQYAAPRI